MEKIDRFKKWYKSFLMLANDSSISAEQAENEAERVSEMVDCEALVDIAQSQSCQLCADDSHVMPASSYGLTDFGNSQPESRTEKVGGIKFGTVLPVTLPVCKRCRRNFLLVQNLPTILSTVLIALALIAVNLPGVKQKLFDSKLFVPANMRPFFVFIVIAAICIILCAALRRLLIESLSSKTTFNVLDATRLNFLKDKGWFKLYSNKHFSQILFSDEKPPYMQDCDCGCENECENADNEELYEKTVRLTDERAASFAESQSESRTHTTSENSVDNEAHAESQESEKSEETTTTSEEKDA